MMPLNLSSTQDADAEGAPSSTTSEFTDHHDRIGFGNALTYVNKIKQRFLEQPGIYTRFLEILHHYQREQCHLRDTTPANSLMYRLIDQEVYIQVSILFEQHHDLLNEFGSFLPLRAVSNIEKGTEIDINQTNVNQIHDVNVNPAPKAAVAPKKRPYVHKAGPSKKKSVPNKNISTTTAPAAAPSKPLVDAEKYETLNEFTLFDKIRQTMKCYETYEKFIRCLKMYHEELINRVELVHLIEPFLGKHTKLFDIFKGFLFLTKDGHAATVLPESPTPVDKPTDKQVVEIDFSTCKRLGTSYCQLPKDHFPPLCSGRSNREKDVLNDEWVSVPAWSEESSFAKSRKTPLTQYEGYVHHCEDERYELDIVLETNTATILIMEHIMKKISGMTAEEVKVFKLDDNLGGTSDTICVKAIRRLYGDKTPIIVDGLKNTPSMAIPILLRRLKSKGTEWRDAQKGFNKVWQEQMEKYYLKSLDHQNHGTGPATGIPVPAAAADKETDNKEASEPERPDPEMSEKLMS